MVSSSDFDLAAAQECAKKAYDFTREAEQADDWKVYATEGDVTIERRNIAGHSLQMYRGVKTFPGNPRAVQKSLFAMRTESLKKWDKTFKHLEPEYLHKDDEVEEGEPLLHMDYMISELPWPVWNRDFVIANGVFVSDDKKKVYQAAMSVPDESYPPRPPQPKQMVRGHIDLSSFVFAAADEDSDIDSSQNTRLERILLVDPKGSLPSWLVNSMAKKQIVDFVNNIATLA
mmetsp:Transcript_3105/g.10842  ORF Transcript_3105/g.10842 Transcript_3105/m.10842 type:complete len:230 (-) Transcript_3105:55-744(-)